MEGRILITGGGANQVRIIARARQLGLTVFVMDASRDAPGFSEADAGEVGDICSAAAIEAAARKHRVDGIYPAAEWGVDAVAEVTEALGLPGPGRDAGRRVRDKLAMRQALQAAGEPVPAFHGVVDVREAEHAAADIGLPLIVKPADGNASRGVTIVQHMEDVSLAFRLARKNSRCGVVLLESFIEGEEYNVDGLVHDGQYRLGGITGKERSRPPHRFDLGIFMPPPLSAELRDRLVSAVERGLAALGYRHGTTHVEVIAGSDGVLIVEAAGRPGGGRIPTDLIPLTTGTDYIADSFRVALGQAPSEQPAHRRGAALFWIPSRSGVVEAVEGVENAKALRGVHDVIVPVRVGDRVGHITDCVSRDRIGYVLTSGDTVEEAVETARRAQEQIRIVTRPTTHQEQP